jgi:hypothetical protein
LVRQGARLGANLWRRAHRIIRRRGDSAHH